MKTITLFECEICGTRHNNIELARACEAQGRHVVPPRGAITSSWRHHNVFGIDVSQGPESCQDRRPGQTHALWYSQWIWRDADGGHRYGDSGPTDHGGGGAGTPHTFSNPRYAEITDELRRTGRYARMYADLLHFGVTPLAWNGTGWEKAPYPLDPEE